MCSQSTEPDREDREEVGDVPGAPLADSQTLLVCGSEEQRVPLGDLLSGRGYQIAHMDNPAAVLSAMRNLKPSCVLMLTNEKETADRFATQFASATKDTASRPLLMFLMPECSRLRRFELYEAGADDILLLPCSPEILAVRVNALCKVSRNRSQFRQT